MRADSILSAIIVPILATIVMGLMRTIGRDLHWGVLAEELGWDFCVLGLGLVGAAATSPLAREVPGLTAMLTLTNVLLGIVVLHLRASRWHQNIVRLTCVVCGVLAVGLPCVVALVKGV